MPCHRIYFTRLPRAAAGIAFAAAFGMASFSATQADVADSKPAASTISREIATQANVALVRMREEWRFELTHREVPKWPLNRAGAATELARRECKPSPREGCAR